MNEDNKSEMNLEKSINITNEPYPSQQETLQDETSEIADLKKQISELKELMSSQTNSLRPNLTDNTNLQNEDTGLITFRDIQRARSIHSVPISNKRTKNQMYHYYSSNDTDEMERTIPKKARQPLEIRYTNSEKRTKKKHSYQQTEESQHNIETGSENVNKKITLQEYPSTTRVQRDLENNYKEVNQATENHILSSTSMTEAHRSEEKHDTSHPGIQVQDNQANNTTEPLSTVKKQDVSHQPKKEQMNQTTNESQMLNEKQGTPHQAIEIQENQATNTPNSSRTDQKHDVSHQPKQEQMNQTTNESQRLNEKQGTPHQAIEIQENQATNTPNSSRTDQKHDASHQPKQEQMNQTTNESQRLNEKQGTPHQAIEIQENQATNTPEPISSTGIQESTQNKLEMEHNQDIAPSTEMNFQEETASSITRESSNESQQSNRSQMESENTPSSQDIHTNNKENKKSVFEYILGKIK